MPRICPVFGLPGFDKGHFSLTMLVCSSIKIMPDEFIKSKAFDDVFFDQAIFEFGKEAKKHSTLISNVTPDGVVLSMEAHVYSRKSLSKVLELLKSSQWFSEDIREAIEILSKI